MNLHVGGRVLAISKSQMPVLVPISATLSVGEVRGMLGCMRNPKVFVVAMCCSSSLLEWFNLALQPRLGLVSTCLSGISLHVKGAVLRCIDSAMFLLSFAVGVSLGWEMERKEKARQGGVNPSADGAPAKGGKIQQRLDWATD